LGGYRSGEFILVGGGKPILMIDEAMKDTLEICPVLARHEIGEKVTPC
jgi:hypothetical protein